MVTKEEILILIKDIESDQVEKTEAINDADKFSQAICIFSNNLPDHKKPSYLIIGVKDNGTIAGLKVTDQLLQNLAALRSSGTILPVPTLNIAKFDFPEGEIAVIEVLPSDIPPVRYKGTIWVRVGPRRAIASEHEERILTERRTSSAKTFDALPNLNSTINDLVMDLFSVTYRVQAISAEVIAENHREITFQLASLRFYDLARDCPTHAGILLFGKDPLYWMPGAYIQFLRFDGNSLAAQIKNERRLDGDLLTLLRELDTLLDIQVTRSLVKDTNLREKEIADYPMIALRELLMNAVMHRSYQSTAPVKFYWFTDRIEIQSPGGLYGEASQANFPNQNTYRNPVIAEAMKNLGYVNKYGSGVVRAQDSLAKNGNKPAEFKFDSGYVLVTLWRRQ